MLSETQKLTELTSRLLIEEERSKQAEQVNAAQTNKFAVRKEVKCFKAYQKNLSWVTKKVQTKIPVR